MRRLCEIPIVTRVPAMPTGTTPAATRVVFVPIEFADSEFSGDAGGKG